MIAPPEILPWVIHALPGLDAADEAGQLATLRSINRMIAGRLSWGAIAGMITLRRAPHLEAGAPVNAATVGRMLENELDRVPLGDQLWLGALLQQLRVSRHPTIEEVRRVRRIRDQICAERAS